ncbi:membrane protein required for colicin V production [Palleronia salina]|uniref:Membrane protein required for colicin V production n=2 Tax=Palleronia TaxID=315422 RepID=A0A1M6FZS3_9RHOB|nr:MULTISPECIES: CvpA family protein [Palleronia]SEN45170.1 membrane protein required for colicin V production [Palleronia pelagia]SHJ03154.1 membrane protein required for colicin V production [Palleronia salina]
MDGFTLVDGIVAAVIVVSALLAYSRGFVREAMAIVGWIAAAIAAFVLAPPVQPLVRELPVIGDFLGDSCELSIIAAFAAVFAVALVVASIFTPLLSGAIRDSALGGVDQGAGFLFGVARGVLLVAVAFIVYDRVAATESMPMVDNSRTAQIFARSQSDLDSAIPDDAPGWIVEQYESLVSVCEG